MTMNKDLAKDLKFLRLGGLLVNWDNYLALAEKENFSHFRLLHHIVEEEVKIKQENAFQRRLHMARIPEILVMETYPFHLQPNLDRMKILSLYDSFDYMEKTQNVIWVGPTGCGKTGLATSFLVQAIRRGYKSRHILFSDLLGELYRSMADHSQDKVIKRYLSYDCLLIDEVGYIDVEPVQVGHFFTLMQKRHKKRTTLITSNLGFKEWRTFLKNDHLAAALIDRLTENSDVINMRNCGTIRPKKKEIQALPDKAVDVDQPNHKINASESDEPPKECDELF